ncbi:MAG: hypothetical protein ABTQ29_08530 [Siculibacillus sp.]
MTGTVRSLPKPNEAAAYIEQSAVELRDLALRSGMPFLGYLIDMARLEAASQVLTPPRPPVPPAEPRPEPAPR